LIGPPSSLPDAVLLFNIETLSTAFFKEQPPLTEEEVVAAIRSWSREATPGVTDEVYDRYQQIAETGTLPEDAELRLLRTYARDGFMIDVWWIDLTIRTGERTGYSFRIRDQKISSRPMTPVEEAKSQRIRKLRERHPRNAN
jgi:hypothetical protein